MPQISIRIVNRPEDAPNYRRDEPATRSGMVTEAVIVLRGTVEGRSTVDLQFQDQDGGKCVGLLTGALLQSLASAVRGAEAGR